MPDAFDEVYGSDSGAIDAFDAVYDEAPAPQPLSIPETLYGGTQKVLNALTLGFGDELVAGGSALLDRAWDGQNLGNAYDERLNQVRGITDRYSQANPIESAVLDIAPAFLTPLPKVFGAETGAVNALKNVAKGTGVGVTYGGVSGFGNERDGFLNRLESAKDNAIIGGLFGGGLQAASEVGQKVFSGGRSLLNALTGRNIEPEAQQIARETVAKYTDVPQLVAALEKKPIASPFIEQMPVSEQVLDPGLGLLTRTLEKDANLPAKTIKQAMDAERAIQRINVFGEHQGQVRSPEDFGSVLREELSNAVENQNGKVRETYNKAYTEGEGTTSIFGAKKNISDSLAKFDNQNKAIDSNTRNLIDNFRQNNPNKLTLEELNGQRQEVGQLLGQIRARGPMATIEEKRGSTLLSQLFGDLDNAEVSAKSTFTKSQINNIEKARGLTAERGELFQKKGAKDILATDPFGEYKLFDSKVRGKVISSPEQARQIVDGLKKASDKGVRGKEAIGSDLFEVMRERSTSSASGEFTPAKFANNWDKLKPIADEVLNPIQKKAITSVRNDLVRQQLHEASAAHASKGQSITSQDMGSSAFVKDTINQAIKNRTGTIGKLFDVLGADRTAQVKAKVDENLVKLAFDRNFAKEFLKPQSQKQIQKISEAVILRALTPALLGSESLQGLGKSSALPAALTLEQASQILQQEGKGRETVRAVKVSPLSQQPNINVVKSAINKVAADLPPLQKQTSQSIDSALNRGEAKLKESEKTPRIKKIEAIIDSDPVDSAIYEVESGRDPEAKNPVSSASGAFQLVKRTARALGVKDVFDIEDNYSGYKRLRAENEARFGDDPAVIYAGHYLGAPLLDKVLKGKPLTKTEAEQVAYLKAKALPRFERIYKSKVTVSGENYYDKLISEGYTPENAKYEVAQVASGKIKNPKVTRA